jgi:16S rRNA (cytosine967-C5)-methyltransferase
MGDSWSPRRLAYELCSRVWKEGAYANLAWEELLATSSRSTEEKAFATHLAYGTLRHRGTIDRIIEAASGRKQEAVDQELWWVMQLGTHQWLWMRTPAHAVVNESVNLAKALGLHRGSGVVNAVMRKITSKTREQWLHGVAVGITNPLARLAVTHSHPQWLVGALGDALADCDGSSEAELEALLEANNTPTTPHFALLPGLARHLANDSPLPYSPIGVFAAAGSPGADSRVRSGTARVQDEGSQLAALILTDMSTLQEGERLLDMCSGPGGKSAVLAARATEHSAHLTAVEKAPHRAELVTKALAPFAGTSHPPTVIVGDADVVLANRIKEFDRVLLDAPCTGAGALRRRPESRWRKSPDDLEGLTELQRTLLTRAVDVCRPGGVIVYVTCSPLVAETTAQMEWLANTHPVTLLDTPSLLDTITRTPLVGHRRGQAVQLWPHRHQTDAMFIQAIRVDG